MTISHMQFQRELAKKDIPTNTAYMLTLIFEQTIELAQQLTDQAKALVAMADNIQGFVNLHEETQRRVQRVERMGRPDGIEINSMMPDPEDK